MTNHHTSNITLKDIRLREYTLDSLPRLAELRENYFKLKPTICIERARYVTEYLRDMDDPADPPGIRQAKKVHHFLRNKAAVFHDSNLLAGSTTSKPLGAPLFPEFFALTLWPELNTVSTRAHNPQILSKEDAEELNFKIFPFWMEKNVLELTRKRFGNSTGLKLFEDLVFFIAGKAGCISHAVPNYVPMIEKGLIGLVEFASEKEKECLTSGNKEAMAKAEFYQAVQIALNGILEYACHLAEKAELLASITADADQKKELEEMAACCRRVPAHPATSFREAVNAVWISQVGIHAENINMAMSPGRLDQLLYPYYRRDIEAGRLTVEQALEILGLSVVQTI